MKNAMKKLLSLVLVAMILVSAVPHASAAELITPIGPGTGSGSGEGGATAAPAQMITVYVVVDNTMMHGEQYEVPMGSTVADIYDAYNGTFSDAEYKMVTNMDGQLLDGSITEKGVKLWLTRSTYTVTLKLTVDGKATQQAYNNLTKADADAQWDEAFYEPATTAKYINSSVTPSKYNIFFNSGESAKNGNSYMISLTAESKEIILDDGDDSTADLIIPGYNGGNNSGNSGNTGNSGNSGSNGSNGGSNNGTTGTVGGNNNNNVGSSDNYHKTSGDVVLEICMGQNQVPVKTVSIKSGIASDGRVTLSEVKSVVKYYYNAIDTDTGIVYDGLYLGQTNYNNVLEWVNDQKVDTVDGLYKAANNSKYVTIRVYISNAKAGTGNADSSNPKTGDNIFMAVSMMTVSASALAVAFYLNKKRAI